jgi:Pectate lyase superfamily protein
LPYSRLYDFQPGTTISSSQIDNEFNNLVNAANNLENDLGDITNLKTTKKNSAVEAINETYLKIKGFINIAEYGAVGDGVTSDQAAIMNAVTDAYNNGKALYWGKGTYVSTDNIPNFHNVKHFGDGVVKRGSDLFYISPKGTQRNKIYVAASGGSNTFDGISSDKPVAELQTAFNYLANYAPILTGYWEIILTSGTFSKRAELKAGLLSENPIEITGADVGGHPNIPTTIISEGTGIAAVGILVSDGSKIKVKNIKFVGFNGSTSSAGIKANNGSQVITENCHFDSCYYGVSGEKRSSVVVPDGIFNNCGYLNGGGGSGAGIRSLQLNNHTIGIQNAGTRTSTAIFQNCYYAVLAQESSTGHIDWCTVKDCANGVVVRVNARANVDGTLFQRNGSDIRVDSNGHVYITANTQFGTGADESTNRVVTSAGGNITTTRIVDGKEFAYSTIEKSFDIQYINQPYNTTSNSAFYSATLKAPFWKGTPSTITPIKKLFFRIFGTLNGTNSNKRINVRLGTAVANVTFTSSETGSFKADGYIYFTNTNEQFLFMNAERHLGTSTRKSLTKGTNDMSSDVALTLEAQVDNSLDSVHIDVVEVGWAG